MHSHPQQKPSSTLSPSAGNLKFESKLPALQPKDEDGDVVMKEEKKSTTIAAVLGDDLNEELILAFQKLNLDPQVTDINERKRLPVILEPLYAKEELEENENRFKWMLAPLNLLVIAYVDWLIKKNDAQENCQPLIFSKEMDQQTILNAIRSLIQTGAELSQFTIENKENLDQKLIGLPAQLIDAKSYSQNTPKQYQYSPLFLIVSRITYLERCLNLKDNLWDDLSAFPFPEPGTIFNEAGHDVFSAVVDDTKDGTGVDEGLFQRLLKYPSRNLKMSFQHTRELATYNVGAEDWDAFIKEGAIITGERVVKIVKHFEEDFGDDGDIDDSVADAFNHACEVREMNVVIEGATPFVHTFKIEIPLFREHLLCTFRDFILDEAEQSLIPELRELDLSKTKKLANLRIKFNAIISKVKNQVIQNTSNEDEDKARFQQANTLFDKFITEIFFDEVVSTLKAKKISDLPDRLKQYLQSINHEALVPDRSLVPTGEEKIGVLAVLGGLETVKDIYVWKAIAQLLVLNQDVQAYEATAQQALFAASLRNHVGKVNLLTKRISYPRYPQKILQGMWNAPYYDAEEKKLIPEQSKEDRHKRVKALFWNNNTAEKSSLAKLLGMYFQQAHADDDFDTQCVLHQKLRELGPELVFSFAKDVDRFDSLLPRDKQKWNGNYSDYLSKNIFSSGKESLNIKESWYFHRHFLDAAHVELKKFSKEDLQTIVVLAIVFSGKNKRSVEFKLTASVFDMIVRYFFPTGFDKAPPMNKWFFDKVVRTLDKDKLISVIPKTNQPEGWNCFDLAVGVQRQNFVEFALAESKNTNVRKLLAPEIRHAAALTVVLMNMKQASTRETAKRIAELFKISDALQNTPEQKLVQAEIKSCIVKDHSSGDETLERYALPAIMRTKELQEIFTKYENAHVQMQPIISKVNDAIERKAGERLSQQALDHFFLNADNQIKYDAAYRQYQTEKENIFNPCEKALADFCMRRDVYENYILHYYGQKNWVAFQSGRNHEVGNTSAVDIYALMLGVNIVIFERDKKGDLRPTYQTTSVAGEKTLGVVYNGRDHFVALDAAALESKPTKFIPVGSKRELESDGEPQGQGREKRQRLTLFTEQVVQPATGVQAMSLEPRP